jgi:hypothetical protein
MFSADGLNHAAAAAGLGDEGFEKGDPKRDVGFPWSPIFDTTGADVDAPKGAFTKSGRAYRTSVEPEAIATEELDPKAKVEF